MNSFPQDLSPFWSGLPIPSSPASPDNLEIDFWQLLGTDAPKFFEGVRMEFTPEQEFAPIDPIGASCHSLPAVNDGLWDFCMVSDGQDGDKLKEDLWAFDLESDKDQANQSAPATGSLRQADTDETSFVSRSIYLDESEQTDLSNATSDCDEKRKLSDLLKKSKEQIAANELDKGPYSYHSIGLKTLLQLPRDFVEMSFDTLNNKNASSLIGDVYWQTQMRDKGVSSFKQQSVSALCTHIVKHRLMNDFFETYDAQHRQTSQSQNLEANLLSPVSSAEIRSIASLLDTTPSSSADDIAEPAQPQSKRRRRESEETDEACPPSKLRRKGKEATQPVENNARQNRLAFYLEQLERIKVQNYTGEYRLKNKILVFLNMIQEDIALPTPKPAFLTKYDRMVYSNLKKLLQLPQDLIASGFSKLRLGRQPLMNDHEWCQRLQKEQIALQTQNVISTICTSLNTFGFVDLFWKIYNEKKPAESSTRSLSSLQTLSLGSTRTTAPSTSTSRFKSAFPSESDLATHTGSLSAPGGTLRPQPVVLPRAPIAPWFNLPNPAKKA